MTTLEARTVARGQVTRIALDIVHPDGSRSHFEHEIGPEVGGILFDDGLVRSMLTGSIDNDERLWKDGLELWAAEENRPSYLLLPRLLERITGSQLATCAAMSTGQCVGGGACRETGKHCG